jgi:three-Cys-motif partner protein
MNPESTNDDALTADDGMILPEVGPWVFEKHRKIGYYAKLFSGSMKNRWDCRVFIDLFAGAGKAKIKDTGEIVPGSPLVVLGMDVPFDQYIFCEVVEEQANALKTRVDQLFPNHNAVVLNLDANQDTDNILANVPRFDSSYKGLSFCFVDPFNAGNLHFETIRRIAQSLYVDFVVLIPSYMDIKRNWHNYTKASCHILDRFLGTAKWRAEWESGRSKFSDFGVFIADQFGKQMTTLKYHYDSTDDYEVVRIGQDRSLYLYHLGFFSRSTLGVQFWKETRERTSNQLLLKM